MPSAWKPFQRSSAINSATPARPDIAGGRHLCLLMARKSIDVVEVVATRRPTTAVHGHAVGSTMTVVDHHEPRSGAVVTTAEDSTSVTLITDDLHRDHSTRVSRILGGNGMASRDRTAISREALVTVNYPQMDHEALRPTFRSRHSHRSARRPFHPNRQCQINSLDSFLCSSSRLHLHPCPFKYLVVSLEVFHHLHHLILADRSPSHHRT